MSDFEEKLIKNSSHATARKQQLASVRNYKRQNGLFKEGTPFLYIFIFSLYFQFALLSHSIDHHVLNWILMYQECFPYVDKFTKPAIYFFFHKNKEQLYCVHLAQHVVLENSMRAVSSRNIRESGKMSGKCFIAPPVPQ